MATTEIFAKVARRIDGYQDLAIEYERRLTAIPALGPENNGEGEVKKAALIKEILQELGADVIEEINAPDDRVPDGYRPNLLVRFKGKSNAKTIWIMSHMDIVPPGELKLWETDPYEVVVKDGKIYGRGVEDNQQGMVAGFLAVRALKEEGILPEYDVGLAIVADEETGSKKGLHYVLSARPDAFRKQDIIIVPDAGNSDGTMIEVAEKSILWLKFTTVGKQCHGSTPEKGINAHKAAAHLIVKLNSLYQVFDKNDPLFSPPISTFEPTKKEANVPNVNTIPGDDVFYMDSRILPSYTVEEVEAKIQQMIKEIEQQFGVKVTTESPQREPAAPPTPVDAPVVQALKKAIKEVYAREGKPMGIGGGTVAAFFRRSGYHAAVWSTLDEMAHQPNEYAVLANLLGDAKVFAHVALQQ
ncbi:diaminopimelate aminotransferase [candidate division KSB1 bacterium]|nr:M20 family metallo-hydrolase [bacterium]OQX60654.1 MAG: diaminopimelate aminotransferase [candidate division KSB1 bacterium 4484_219]RKY77262.1 MAG: diaminopimelate aminotransferase [candidate division KSB1 bacterium]RKY80430.1 MAG: diaminopimelate aminotransferase [candidate division KSB1 bacterium]RKY89499.1 MAG: diaminopimelate aminotransferase [candidate division KSB1 bacterium]